MTIAEQLCSILDGVNPLTGEIFDLNELTTNPEISKAILILALSTQNGLTYKKPKPQNLLNRPSKKIFKKLSDWRLNEAITCGVPAYLIFSNATLYAISECDAHTKKDLLLCPGINKVKYELYADAVFDILKEYI